MALLCCETCGHAWIGRMKGAACPRCRGVFVFVEAGAKRGRRSSNPFWLCGSCNGTYQSKRELPRCRRCYAQERRAADLMAALVAEEEGGGEGGGSGSGS